ncbi:hypothetical protein ES702_07026 [subsurface metagenome]
MAKAKYFGKDQESRSRQLANLNRRGRTQDVGKVKTSFLKDPKNQDIRFFIQNHYILENGKPLKLEKWQTEILDALYPLKGKSNFDMACLGLPKKMGKTEFLGAICLWELLFSPSLAAEVYNCSGDLDQAKLLFKRSARAVKRSKEMSKVCKVLATSITCPARNASYECISADIDSSEGKNPSLCVMDEFSTSSYELWTALQTGRAAREGRGESTLAILIGTAGYDLTSEFYRLYQKGLRGEDEGMYFFWSHEQVSSFSSPSWLARMKRRLQPAIWMRYYENRWVAGAGSFVDEADIARCLDSSLSPTGVGKSGISYIVACDLGLTKARTCRIIVHKENHLIIIDSIRVWEGTKLAPVMIEDIEADLIRCNNYYNYPQIICDPWQMQSSIQRLKKEGIRIKEFTFSAPNLAKLSNNLYQLLHSGTIKFWADKGLVDELLSVRSVQKSYGVRIDALSSGFSDRVITLGMCALACVELPDYSQGMRIVLGTERKHAGLLGYNSPALPGENLQKVVTLDSEYYKDVDADRDKEAKRRRRRDEILGLRYEDKRRAIPDDEGAIGVPPSESNKAMPESGQAIAGSKEELERLQKIVDKFEKQRRW